MGRIAHSSAHGDALQLAREYIEHRLSRDERGRAERDGQRIARPVIVATRLPCALRHGDRVQGGHPGRGEVVERGVNVPAIEARDARCLIGGRDWSLVEGRVGRVLERRCLEALVIVDGAVANQLHLRHARDRLEVWMEDGLFGRLRLVVAMAV